MRFLRKRREDPAARPLADALRKALRLVDDVDVPDPAPAVTETGAPR